MDKETMKKFNAATEKGLEIFKHYIETVFELDNVTKSAHTSGTEFRVTFSKRYDNYIIFLKRQFGGQYITEKLNAIWFVKEVWGLTEKETYSKIDSDMNLGILTPLVEKQGSTLINL
jgi:hypothetical protein